jgi:hypothetical protein
MLAVKRFDRCIYHDFSDPSFEGSLESELRQVLKNLDEGILQHILGFHTVAGVAQAHPEHLAGVPAEEFLLALLPSAKASLDEFLFSHACLSLIECPAI